VTRSLFACIDSGYAGHEAENGFAFLNFDPAADCLFEQELPGTLGRSAPRAGNGRHWLTAIGHAHALPIAAGSGFM
jgi:hypothetical protein